jgi:putative ABC transport system permease protein
LQDFRFAVRGLRKAPGFAMVVVLTLALGIGANTAIFSVVNGVVLRPLPYRAPDKLVFIWDGLDWIGIPRAWVQGAELQDLRTTTSFEGFASMRQFTTQLTGDGAPEEILGGFTSANLFALLGVAPALGRTFVDGEDVPGADPVAVLDHGFWQLRFGGDSSIVGREIVLGGDAFTVVGVLPPEFDFQIHSSLGSPLGPDIWTPDPTDLNSLSRGSHRYAVLARIRDDVAEDQAFAELAALSRRMDGEHYNSNGFAFRPVPLLGDLVKDVRPALLVLFGSVGFVLLIATANIATILMARAHRRDREFAVRRSLGAGNGRLVRQVATETVLLSVIGAVLGLAIAAVGVDSLVALAPPGLPRSEAIGVDVRVLAFAGFLAMVTGMICSVAPALQISHAELSSALQGSGRGSTASRKVLGVRNALIATEFALSLVLLAGTGLLIRSFVFMQRVDPGFHSAAVLTVRISLPASKYSDLAERVAWFQGLLDRVGELPGVTDAGAASSLPLSGSANQTGVYREEPVDFSGQPDAFVDWFVATPGYFRAMGIALLSGRAFGSEDRAGGVPTVVIDETLASQLWPAGDAVGRQFFFRGLDRTVVGVVRHARLYRIEADDRPHVYQPHTQVPATTLSLAMRTSADPTELAGAVRSVVWERDPDQPVSLVQTMAGVVGNSMAQRRFSMLLMVAFGVGALMLAALGLYGVTAYSVSQRTQEIGLRMALGAKRTDVLGLVFRQASRSVALGLVLGLVAALAIGRVLSTMVYEVSTRDPMTLVGVSVVLASVALLASYLPARRASRVDPVVALRRE